MAEDARKLARERLLHALPMFRQALKQARDVSSEVRIGILAVYPEGKGGVLTGEISDVDDFIKDLEVLLGDSVDEATVADIKAKGMLH